MALHPLCTTFFAPYGSLILPHMHITVRQDQIDLPMYVCAHARSVNQI
jgi:hypothetical protein